MLAPKMSVYKSLSGKILRKTRRINSLLNTWISLLNTLLLVQNTLDGCQATNTITDTGIPRSRESGCLVYLS